MNNEFESMSTGKTNYAIVNDNHGQGHIDAVRNDENEFAHTPKRKLSGEGEINPRKQLFTGMMNDGDNEGFQIVDYQRKKQQLNGNGDKNQGVNDVIHEENDRNNSYDKHEDKQNRKRTIFTSCTFVNGEIAAMNHNLRRTEKKNVNQQNEKTSDNRYQDEISRYAFNYAIDQHIPPLTIKCEPTKMDNNHAIKIKKELFLLIDEKFRKLNPKYNKSLGFDYWYIDRDGNIKVFTRKIELFMFLCDKQNYPDKINNTKVFITPPKKLPPQCSAILKFVSKEYSIEDVLNEIRTKYKSVINVPEMKGTIRNQNRHIRLDMSNQEEYIRLINEGEISICGQVIEVTEFLAPPRLLICSKCNTPGHIKKECKSEIELCKRCGGNRLTGEHKQCEIQCHHCKGNHESISYQCPVKANFREKLFVKGTPPLSWKNFLDFSILHFFAEKYSVW